MQTHLWPALVTLLALLFYHWLGMQVWRARQKTGIREPAVTGDPLLERAFWVHYNTLEWLPTFLASMWILAIFWNDRVAASIGVLWIVGRMVYARGYMADPAKRGFGFMIQALVTLVLVFGSIGRVVYGLAVLGG